MKKFIGKIGLFFYGLALWCKENPDKLHSGYALFKSTTAWVLFVLTIDILFTKLWFVPFILIAIGVYNGKLAFDVCPEIFQKVLQEGDEENEGSN